MNDPRCLHPEDCPKDYRAELCKHCGSLNKWSDEKVTYLKVLNAGGATARQMAGAINQQFPGSHFTRNSIIGKMHRIGLKMATSTGPRRSDGLTHRGKRAAGRILSRNKAALRPLRKPVPEVAKWDGIGRISFLDRRRDQCAWIVGDIFGFDTMCCGNPAVRGSWCEFHGGVVFRRADIARGEVTVAQYIARRGASARLKQQMGSYRAGASRRANALRGAPTPSGGDRDGHSRPAPPRSTNTLLTSGPSGADKPYDGIDDFAKSIDVAYEAIRERMAKGGPGWTPK